MPPKIHGFHEIAVVVTDLERSEKFYKDVLGMEVLLRIPDQSVIMRMGDPPHHFIGLWLPNAHAAYPNEKHGKMHFTMNIDMADADAWEAHFKAKGVHAPRRVKENGDIHFDFLDPDGHPLEFWARTGVLLSTMPDIKVPAESRNLFYNLKE
jgi:lactoylglutathione lyase